MKDRARAWSVDERGRLKGKLQRICCTTLYHRGTPSLKTPGKGRRVRLPPLRSLFVPRARYDSPLSAMLSVALGSGGSRARGSWGAGHTAHTACHTAPAPCPLTPEYDAAHTRTSARRIRNTFPASARFPPLASLLNRLCGRPPLASCGLCCGRPSASPSRAGVCVMSRRAGKLEAARHASPAPPRSLAVPPARRTSSPPRAEQRPHPPGLCAHCARRTYTVRHVLNGPQHEP